MEALATVAGSLIDGVASRVKDQQAQLRKVTGALQRTVKKRVSQQEEALRPLVQAVDDFAAISAAESAITGALAPATSTPAQVTADVAAGNCAVQPTGFPVVWTDPVNPASGQWWVVTSVGAAPGAGVALTWGQGAATWDTGLYGRSGPYPTRAAALAAWPTAEEIAQACGAPQDGAGSGGTTGGTGDGSGSTGGGAGFACPPGFIVYDDPRSCFPGQVVPEGFYWRAEDRQWVSQWNPTCDPRINIMLPPERQCVRCPVVCLPDSSGGSGTGTGSGGGTTGNGSGGSTGGYDGSGSDGGGGTSGPECPAPVVQCPAPQVVVNVAAPIVNVTCTPDGTTTDTGGTGDDTGDGSCPILVQPLAPGHVGGPSGPDTLDGLYTAPDGSVVGPFPDGLPPEYTLDPLIACPPDCGPGAQGSWTDTGGKVCVAGEAHDVGGVQQDTLNGPRWGQLDVCKTIDKVNANAHAAVSELVPAEVMDLLKADTPDFNGFAKKWSAGAPWYLQPVLEGFINVGTHFAHYITQGGLFKGDCAPLAMALPLVVRAIVDATEKWLGLGLRDTKVGLDYWTNYVCPTTIPGIGEASSAYLADTIDHDLWRCWVRANNAWDVPAERIVQARRTRPSQADAIRLHRRGIVDEPEYLDMMRGNGVLRDRERELLERAAEFVPGPGDIIAMMKRDVFDEAVVAKYQYDEEFQEKFSLKAQALAKAAGLSVETAKLYWRMHWRIPSDSAGFQMLQRLRPGAVDPELVTTHANIEELLGVNDMAPEWRARMIAIAYRRPTSVQARKSFNIFAIDKNELIGYILDIGYSPKAAQNLADTWEEDRYGFWMRSVVGKLYMAGAYSLYQFRESLTRFSPWNAEKAAIVQYLDGIVKANTRVKCIAATKHLFMMGTLTLAGAQAQLIGTGMDPGQAIDHTTEWACERSANGKLLPAAKLCRWYQTGLMNTAEFSNRLGALGYFPADVLRIIGECDSQAKARVQAAATKKAIAAERAAEKVAKKAQADAAKAETTLERDLVKAERLIGKIAQLTGDGIDTLGPDIRQRLALAQAHAGLSRTQAVALLAAVVSELGKKGATDWAPIWDALLSDAITARAGDKKEE